VTSVSVLRESILGSDDIVREPVDVPEWGVTLEVRSMTGAERTRIMDLAANERGQVNLTMVYPEVVIATTFDPESGEQVFEPSDRDALLAKAAVPLERLATVGMRLSGFTQDAQDAAGKDSSDSTTDGSPSN
jgi:hypothetical protein